MEDEELMLLDQDFRHEFTWRGKKLRVGFILPEAKKKISESMNHMSKETVRHRFFGIKNGFTDRELKYLTEIDGYHHFAMGIEEVENPERGIAILRLVRDDLYPHEGEMAILIIDDYQKMGLGSLLMQFCIAAAAERGMTALRFTYLPDNHAIVNLIKRFGSPKVDRLASDYVQMKMPITKELVDNALKALSEFFVKA